MPGACLYSNEVTLFKVYVVDVMIITFPCVFELHFHKIRSVGVTGNVCQPVVSVELFVLSAAGAPAQSSVTAVPYLKFHVFEVHYI